MKYLIAFALTLVCGVASAQWASPEQLPSRERIEFFDRGAQDRWQFDQDLIRARRDAMVDREIRFVDELTGEIRRRFISNLVDQQMPNLGNFGGGNFRERERREIDWAVDRNRDVVLVRPVANSGGGHSLGSGGLLRRVFSCNATPTPQMALVPVRPVERFVRE